MNEQSALFTLDDPRENARAAPYTYILPSAARLGAIRPGDLAKLVFRPTATGRKWDAERMWVEVVAVNEGALHGKLANEPEDIPGLALGADVMFQRWQIINVDFQDPSMGDRYPHSTQREYWQRCLVDQGVINGELKVDYLYREEPDLAQPDDRYPDSGWRIRGDQRTATDREIAARQPAYVAIGAVLNRDDSWRHLVDEPVGSAFRRDFDTGQYVKVD